MCMLLLLFTGLFCISYACSHITRQFVYLISYGHDIHPNTACEGRHKTNIEPSKLLIIRAQTGFRLWQTAFWPAGARWCGNGFIDSQTLPIGTVGGPTAATTATRTAGSQQRRHVCWLPSDGVSYKMVFMCALRRHQVVNIERSPACTVCYDDERHLGKKTFVYVKASLYVSMYMAFVLWTLYRMNCA